MTPLGPLLAAFRIDGQPVRAKHACTCRGGHPGTRPLDTWAAWRATAVASLASYWAGRAPITSPVTAGVVAVFQRPQKARSTFKCRGLEQPYPFPWTEGRVGFVGRPDYDQVWKAALDVAVHAGILLDDQLVQGDAGGGRWYAAVGEESGLELQLWGAP